jgi:transcriptional regulator with XRE-family HTH domain
MDDGRRFREARLSAGLSLSNAAKRIGRTRSAIQKWEAGTNSPSVPDLYRLADAYGTRLYGLFAEVDTFVSAHGPQQEKRTLDAVVTEWSRKANLADKAHAKQFLECARLLPVVPADFAKHWIQALKACAACSTSSRATRTL